MLSLELSKVTATLENVNLRTEKAGPDKVPAADLKVSVAQSADILAHFSPTLKNFLFHTEGTLDLAGGFALRDPHLQYPLARDEEMTGATVEIGFGPGDPMAFDDAKVNAFRITPMDGGSVIVGFRVQCRPTPEQVARLYQLQESGHRVDAQAGPASDASGREVTNLAEALRIARSLANIARCMDAPKEGSIGALVAELDALEERIARGQDFDRGTEAER